MPTLTKPFIIPIFIPHAGCPHRCIFCDQTRTTGEAEALPSARQLHEAIGRFLKYRKDSTRYTEISFYGGNFLGLARETVHCLLTLAQQYVRQGVAQGIRFSTRPDTVDDARIGLIREFSVKTIELGVQSMNDRLLRLSRRGHRAEQVNQAVRLIRRHPYGLGLQMMAGLPGETDAAALATARQVAAMGPDFVRIYPTLVLKGSPLERWYRQGRFTPLTLDEAVERVKALYLQFHKHGIPVIRMGLQPTDELTQGAGVVAGPFHPAFGELVHAALWRDVLRHALPSVKASGVTATIQLHPKLLSVVKGHKNSNVDFVCQHVHPPGLRFQTSGDLPLDTILVNDIPFALCPADPSHCVFD